MPCLILDTSTEQCLIAIAEADQIKVKDIFRHGNDLSTTLMPKIKSLIEGHCKSLKDISEIAIGTGPGSYTGTRVGAAVAKCMTFGLQVPIKTFHSPLAFLPEEEGSFAFIIPTRSGQLYALTGRTSSSGVLQDGAFFFNLFEYNKVENADFFISPMETLPTEFRNRPCYKPIPNLRLLSLLLKEKEYCPLEGIELQYLNVL